MGLNTVIQAALIAYCLYGTVRFRPETAEDWVGITLHALLAAGLVHGVASVLLAAGGFLAKHAFARPLQNLRQRMSTLSNALVNRNAQRQEQQRRIREQREWERSAPERDRRQREAEARARQETQVTAAARKQRDDARMRCELLYNRHAAHLEAVLPRKTFRTLLHHYLSDDQTPECVEERAGVLQQMILEAAGPGSATRTFKTLRDIADFYAERRREIDALPYPDDVRDTYHTLLNRQEDDTLRRLHT